MRSKIVIFIHHKEDENRKKERGHWFSISNCFSSWRRVSVHIHVLCMCSQHPRVAFVAEDGEDPAHVQSKSWYFII